MFQQPFLSRFAQQIQIPRLPLPVGFGHFHDPAESSNLRKRCAISCTSSATANDTAEHITLVSLLTG
jgi:hypothetical protein